MSMKIILEPHDRIVAVVPERTRGPGWSNEIVRVYIHNSLTEEIWCEFLQPVDFSPGMHVLFDIGEATHRSLVGAVPVETMPVEKES